VRARHSRSAVRSKRPHAVHLAARVCGLDVPKAAPDWERWFTHYLRERVKSQKREHQLQSELPGGAGVALLKKYRGGPQVLNKTSPFAKQRRRSKAANQRESGLYIFRPEERTFCCAKNYECRWSK
jgi:hypothetical protein